LGHALFVGSGGDLETFCREFNTETFLTIDNDPGRDPDRVMDLMDLKFPPASFDTVFLLEVLEHVRNPFQAVSELEMVVKTGGQVVMSSPFILGIHDAPNDFFRFTEHGLKILFSDWDVALLRPRTGYLLSVSVLLSRLMVEKRKHVQVIGLALTPLIFLLSPVLRFVDRYLPATITTGYVAIFQKRANTG